MTSKAQLTAQQAYSIRGKVRSTAFICPYPDCNVFAQHHWGQVVSLNVPLLGNSISHRSSDTGSVWLASCEACNREVVFIDDTLIWPRSSGAPAPNPDMPEEIKADFEEARLIYADSPRGAAALLRLALQKLCPHIGATKAGINDAIAELVKAGTVSASLQQALDSVRVIGNEAVHPGTLDLRDDAATVLTLFRLVNFIVEKAITEPKEVAAIYGTLPPDKHAGIAKRDGDAKP